MPQIRMLTSLASEDFAWLEGEVITVTAAQAKTFADGIRAELVREPKKERATRSTSTETA
jgi:hypothetical protein